MVEKSSAFYQGKFIVASKALKLKRDRIVDTAYENAEFYDSLDVNDRYKVRPFSGSPKKDGTRGEPYFAYYPKAPKRRNEDTREGSKETFAHALFKQIFSELKILVFNSYNYSDFDVTAYVEDVRINHSVYDEKNKRYQVDLLYKLTGTEPYSFFYKWNGYVALKVNVSTKASKFKKEVFSEQEIQLLEANIDPEIVKELENIKKQVKLTSKDLQEFTDDALENLTDADYKNIVDEHLEKLYDEAYEKYKSLYISKKWRIFCRPLGEAVTLPEFEERFNMIFGFEQQKEELKKEIAKLTQAQLDVKEENVRIQKNFNEKLAQQEVEFNSKLEIRTEKISQLEEKAKMTVKEAEKKKIEVEESYSTKEKELSRLSQIKKELDVKDATIKAIYNRKLSQRIRNTIVEAPDLKEIDEEITNSKS